MVATHLLKSQEQALVSRLDTQQGTAATHILKNQRQALLAGLKHTKVLQSLTCWRVNDRYCQQAWNTSSHSSHSQTGEQKTDLVSRLKSHQCIAVTHILESQEQALLAGLKHTKTLQPLTFWRAKNKHCQQTWNTLSHSSHTLSEEPRTGIVSRLEMHQGTAATYPLKGQWSALSAGLKHIKGKQPLTNWRFKDRHYQQAGSTLRHSSH